MVDEIRKNLFLGRLTDNRKFDGVKICVLEHEEWNRSKIDPETIVIPIIKTKNLRLRALYYQGIANEINMDAIVRLIKEYLSKDQKVLVHCEIGKERSPLMIAYYLHKTEELPLEIAFKEVKRLHPKAVNRLYWLKDEALS